MSTSTKYPQFRPEPPPFNPPVSARVSDDAPDEDLADWDMWFEEAPAWLVSVLVHMGVVIILGLCALGVQQHLAEQVEVEVAAEPSFSDGELDNSLGSGLNDGSPGKLADEFDESLLPTPIVSDLVSDSQETFSAIDAEWQEMLTSDDGNPSLMSGAGDSPIGGRKGRGNGGEGGGGEGSGLGSAVMDKTSFFGLTGEGGKFVYVFDRSDSMNSVLTRYSEGTVVGTIVPLEAAKSELKRSLSTLSNSSEFQIVFYNHGVEFLGMGEDDHEMLRATPQNKEFAYNYINQMPGLGSTDHRIGLDAGVGFEPDVVFLLTDAQPHDDLAPDVVKRVIKYCKQHRITLNVVHISDRPRPDSTMIWMAEGTGGKHVFLDLKYYAQSVDIVDFIKSF